MIGRDGVLDPEKGQIGRAGSIGSVGSKAEDKYTRHVMVLRSAHRDGTAPRANGLPTIRMYIRAHRPIMLDVLWEADDEDQYERIESYDSSPSNRIACQSNYDHAPSDNASDQSSYEISRSNGNGFEPSSKMQADLEQMEATNWRF